MKYHLTKQGDDVVISFEQLGGQAQTVIDAIVRCRATASACPAGVCVKIGGMETCGAGDALAVRLKPRGEAALFSTAAYLESLFGIAARTPVDPK